MNFANASLLVVDVQCGFTTFCPNELPVPSGLEIVPAINRLLAMPWQRIDASMDWHPPDHCSFRGQRDNLYPPHCVDAQKIQTIWRKGYDKDFEAYALTAQHPGFPALLRASRIDVVAVCGLATNICCFFAARDLRRAGFGVLMVEDASAGIDVPAAGLFQAKAKEEGIGLGINYVKVREISGPPLPALRERG